MTAKAPSIPIFHTSRRVTDGHLAVFDGSSGWLIKDGGAASAASALQSAHVVKTHADILTLPTTTPVIVVPGVANTILWPTWFALALSGWAADYTNLGVQMWLDFDPTIGAGFGILNSGFDGAGVLAGGKSIFRFEDVIKSWNTANIDASILIGLPIVLRVDNGVLGNFTGGDAANRLVVDVVYRTITL